MDTLTGLLDGPRARGAFLLRSLMTPPWSILVRDEAPITVLAIVSGRTWVDGQRLEPGDLAVLRGPDHYTISCAPDVAPTVVVEPGQRCVAPDGAPLHESWLLDTRTWGNDPGGADEMLIGTYPMHGEVTRRLLAALPPLVVLPRWDSAVIPLLREEISRDEPGQDVVLDRLLDLLLIAALRSWFARPDAHAPGWYAAQSDPVVGRALKLMHADPARSWTVAGLATATGTSRAALARRFTALVGEPPMSYLTGWRLDLAADLLREPSATVGAVASKVGYGSAFALSTAFKRVRGRSPREHRVNAPV